MQRPGTTQNTAAIHVERKERNDSASCVIALDQNVLNVASMRQVQKCGLSRHCTIIQANQVPELQLCTAGTCALQLQCTLDNTNKSST